MSKATFRGRNYGELNRQVSGFLRKASAHGRVLVVADMREAADDLVRGCCDDAMRGVYRHGLRDLVLTLSEIPMNERGTTPIRRIAREALSASVTDQVKRKRQLSYLSAVADFPGFAGALARTFEDLRLNRISYSQLRSIGRSGPDLALLLEAYEEQLSIQKFADHALRVELASEAIAGELHDLCGLPLLMIDVQARSVGEKMLLQSLADRASDCMFACTQPVPFMERAPGPAIESGLQSVQEYCLFGRAVPERRPDASVELFSASGEALECVEIARRILGRVRHGVRFDDVAVLLRSPERYRSLIEEALSRARIPVFFSSGARRPNPAGRAFLSLLRCREEGLSATRFAEYLSLSREYSPAAWERMLVDAAVIGGKARWVTRLNGLAEEFRNRYEKAQDDSESERWSRKIESLEDLTKIALPVIQSLDELPAEAKWGEWLDLLSELAASTVEEPEEVLELLDQLRPMAMIGPIRLSQVLLTLGPDLATHRTQTEGNRYGRVFVGSIEEARGLAFDTVFLPGLNEGIFPKLVREDPLLLDEQRAQLGVPTSENDTGLLRTAVACSRERLVASWSRIDLATGRERVPSFYAFELFEAAWGGNPDLKAFETEARKGSESRLGWPAPLDPLNAIDDAEYDLARLRIALKEKEAGSAAYLGEINPHVVLALRARWLRWRKKWGWADGLLSEKEVLPALDRWRPAQHAYSATELEQYARCPYRFLLRSVYHLRPEQDATAIQRMEPRMRGEIYHDVQQHLFERLKSIGSLPIVPENVGECLVVLDEIVKLVGEEARERYAPAVPEVWKADLGRLRADLVGWVHKVVEQASEWTPEHFEWEFQNTRISGGWLLSGRVDLIESHADGSLRITDHKTGKYPEKPALRVGAGEVLQPVLYGLAAESLLGLPVKSGRLFYATLRQNYREIAMPLDAGARASAESVISAVDEALKDAFLPAAPRKDACKNCDYLPVCGPYEEERTGRGKKDSARLHSLTRIRESR